MRFVKILIISRAFRRGKLSNFDKMQVKLFPNFTRKPFDYLLISWVTNYVLFTARRRKIARELYPTARKESSPGFFSRLFSSHHFSKTRTQLIVLFLVFQFSAASFNFVTSSRVAVLNIDAILTLIEIQEMLTWQFCNFTCEITKLTLKFRAKIKE